MLNFEKDYWNEYDLILGLDEAGRGCCAGPLVVAGVIFNKNYVNLDINDSKKLNSKKREELFKIIKRDALAYKIVVYDANYVDLFNPKQTSRNGMLKIVKEIELKPNLIITDFEKIDQTDIKQINLVKGDSKSISVAAASILAKVFRDQLMENYDQKYPQYNFKKHKGYATKDHQNVLEAFGPSPIHRLTYKNVEKCIKK
ncbi:ribonuclease HII [Mycoplasmopsis columbina]|uniref:ribonuclease HII n=1 Tax=Mycoplasmopsis columbina TaxID=114881 RepID=UPI0004A7059B|nr:ribonuclease HII [Mycoplasmopsis columbina]VEU77090.1 ribonuclease H II [Mycoplasmopsis columbina]